MAPPVKHQAHKVYMQQFVELLGLNRDRLLFLDKEVDCRTQNEREIVSRLLSQVWEVFFFFL